MSTLEVYGHLVATDMLSSSYVVPLIDIVEEINHQAKQLFIDFPSLQPLDGQRKGKQVIRNIDDVDGLFAGLSIW